MADPIRAVVGDERPTVTLTLTNDVTRAPVDLSAATTSVSVRFRQAGTTTLLSTISCSKVGDGSGGQVTFDFSGGVLDDVAAGAYEGEVVVSFDGDTHTVYELLRFRVRENLT